MSEPTIEQIDARYREFFPGETPNRSHVQQVLTRKFIHFLQTGGDVPTETLVETFYWAWQGPLDWLGETRQDAILQAAQDATGRDLSLWLPTTATEREKGATE